MNLKTAVSVVLVGACFLGLGRTALAAKFELADALFERRAEGRAVIAEARTAYSSQLESSSVGERTYALDMMSRLTYFEGFLIPESQKESRKAVFERCLADLEAYLSPAQIGETPEFFYWKGVCLASWADANGIASSLKRSAELIRLIEKGIEVDSTFEGGGFYRLGAVVYQELPPVNPFGPTYDLQKSLSYAELAIASPAYSGALDPITATGDYFFDVYVYLAKALKRDGQAARARVVLQDAIARIEQGDTAADRLPETAAHLEKLQKTLAEL